MTEDAIKARLDGLQVSVDKGFAAVDKRLDKVESNVEAVREEGLPRRMNRLEKWRDSLGARVWVLITTMTVGVVLAWAGALFGGGS